MKKNLYVPVQKMDENGWQIDYDLLVEIQNKAKAMNKDVGDFYLGLADIEDALLAFRVVYQEKQ
jgi:hypothetical protein